MSNDEAIQELIKIYGKIPECLGSFCGMKIDSTLSKETLYALAWWLIKDIENREKMHKGHEKTLMAFCGVDDAKEVVVDDAKEDAKKDKAKTCCNNCGWDTQELYGGLCRNCFALAASSVF